MRKSEFNAVFREYVKNNLSPTSEERTFVSEIYEAIQNVLGENNCLQIGSYPRFTSVHPVHDLDVLYILGPWDTSASDPSSALSELEAKLKSDFENPTLYTVDISRQTHSITLSFADERDEFFGVDIVPAYIFGSNEFGNQKYRVPELLSKSHPERKRLNEEVSKGAHQMTWIKSDPRGYITVASQLNQRNDDFRKAVKFIKGWRASCKEMDEDFPLKSFHIEQVVTGYFKQNANLEIYDAIFNFFYDIPAILQRSQIPDRADGTRNIDSYIDGLSESEKELVLQARDNFLIKLEDFAEGDDVESLLEAGLHERASNTESYLFDQKIPILLEENFSIYGRVLPTQSNLMEKILDAMGVIEIDRRIEFRINGSAPTADLFKWKVKNDDNSEEPRGEITDHRTKNDPEQTKYNGSHYVECFAIRNNTCIARTRQNVQLKLLSGPR